MSSSIRVGLPTGKIEEVPQPFIVPSANGNGFRRFWRVMTAVQILADACSVVAAVVCANWLYFQLGVGKQIYYPTSMVALAGLGLGVFIVTLLDRYGDYRPDNSLLRVKETERVLRVSVATFFVVLAFSLFMDQRVSRVVLVFTLLAVPLFLVIEKQLFYSLVRWLHSRGHGVQRVLIYGAGKTGKRIFSALMRSPRLGLNPIAFIDDEPTKAGSVVLENGYTKKKGAQVISGPLTRELLKQHRAAVLMIAVHSLPREKFSQVVAEALSAGVHVAFVPYHIAPYDGWVDYADLDGVLLASIQPPSASWHYDAVKRTFDIAASIILLLLALPLLALLGVLIRLDSPGPVFFVQDRVGLNGRLFKLFKLRTMRVDAPEYSYCPTDPNDPRITEFGRYLRRTSLDELPQLLNVLRGDMSLVGPRPEMPFIVEGYTAVERQRLQVKPGITGLWQLSADRAYHIHENIEYDLYYIRNRNLFLDVAIVLHTIFFAARGI